jgi:hypothetical protein
LYFDERREPEDSDAPPAPKLHHRLRGAQMACIGSLSPDGSRLSRWRQARREERDWQHISSDFDMQEREPQGKAGF